MADVVKYGIQIPNRVFVGGVAFDTKEDELREFFSQYGKVKECKIIKDNQNISRGFAFVTFECKQDAIQTQQLGTVFFKQKKLNLGPAIRQKGVVFNGTAEFENEPVLSTGVYVHPSGYAYTVAPNGVWYFHNPDGSPRARTRGSPSMSYSPNLVHKIQQAAQEHQSVSPTGSAPANQSDATSFECESAAPLPAISGESFEIPYHTTPIIQNQPQPTGYVHHTHSTIGSSNIHVAFQNMSISSHPAAPVPGHHLRLATSPHVQSPTFAAHAHSTIQTMNAPVVHSPVVPVQYAPVGDMFLPYCAQNIKHSLDGSAFDSPISHVNNCHYQVPLQQKQEIYSMMPNDIHHPYMYPTYARYPNFISQAPVYNFPVGDTSPFCYNKKMHSSRSNGGSKGRSNYGSRSEKDTAC